MVELKGKNCRTESGALRLLLTLHHARRQLHLQLLNRPSAADASSGEFSQSRFGTLCVLSSCCASPQEAAEWGSQPLDQALQMPHCDECWQIGTTSFSAALQSHPHDSSLFHLM